MLGKKLEWYEFIDRYEKVVKSDISILINYVKSNKKKWLNFKQDFISKIEEKKLVKDIEELKKSINKLSYDDKVLSKEQKKEILKIVCSENDVDTINKLEKIFNYSTFSKNSDQWGRSEFLTLLGVEVCPYCNRQYITHFKKEGINRSTADLDHYFAQSKYPFLALSIYNFIPCCAICNRTFKRDSDQELIYPYEESFDDEDINFKFTTGFNKMNDFTYLIGENSQFNIELSTINKDIDDEKIIRANSSKEVLNLERIYNSHRKYVSDLAKKFQFYDENWIKSIVDKYGDELELEEKDVVELEFGNYLSLDKFNERPLAKLTRDILEELNESRTTNMLGEILNRKI